jgi:hypothetical protein
MLLNAMPPPLLIFSRYLNIRREMHLATRSHDIFIAISASLDSCRRVLSSPVAPHVAVRPEL